MGLLISLVQGEWVSVGDARVQLKEGGLRRAKLYIDAPLSVEIVRDGAVKRTAAPKRQVQQPKEEG
jgi:hypothetical protein